MSDGQQCWECRTRRLRCGFERPACHKCISRGKSCPGYGPNKPVKFRPALSTGDGAHFKTRHNPKPKGSSGGCEDAVPEPMRDSRSCEQSQALDLYLRTEDLSFMQAATYVNEIRGGWYRDSYLPNNIFNNQIKHLGGISMASRHAMVVRVLTHRALASTTGPSDCRQSWLWTRAHYHAGEAMRAVLNDLRDHHNNMEGAPTRQRLAAAVQSLGLAELFLSANPAWFPHFDVFRSLVHGMGGLREALRTETLSRPALIVYVITTVTSTTTSPTKCSTAATDDFGDLDWLVEEYETWDYAGFPCPAQLFRRIIDVNSLRARHISTGHLGSSSDALPSLLQAINEFDSTAWVATTRTSHHEIWLKVAQIYHLAVRIYAISSLTSLGDTERNDCASEDTQSTKERAAMLKIIKQLPPEPLLSYGLIWPVVIAGTKATSHAEQAAVCDVLLNISRTCGMMAPLSAKQVLERFWASGKNDWEDCFDNRYSFVV